jgi:hypothetical protein
MTPTVREPVLHSHVSDALPDDHPLASENVSCASCDEMVHASNNECMQTWVETGKGPHCLLCFARRTGCFVDDTWGL